MKVYALLFLAGLALAIPSHPRYSIERADEYFENFIDTYKKHYANEDERKTRFGIFKHNLELIIQKNLKSKSAVYGITKFSDLTSEEFIERYTGLSENAFRNSSECTAGSDDSTSGPDSFSWKDQGVVSKPKDQGMCGSCWAFSAIGNVEAHYAMKHNKDLVDLSEQQVVDCDKKSYGCGGTQNIEYPFLYLISAGSMQEKDYPYKQKNGKCKYDASKVKAKVEACIRYHPKTEDELKNLVYRTGPVSIAVDATAMQYYTNHVLDKCPMVQINHVVLIVGYGTEDNTPYWLIKNSWGTNYGENGYIKVKRGINACGLMDLGAIQAVVS